jgi:protein-S-isoprenylcysteine O-methyltransferase Ste14
MMKPYEYSWRHGVLFLLALAWAVVTHPHLVAPCVLAIGGILFVSGETLRVWATGHLRKTEVLTISGPYRHMRDPMYLGTLLIVTGLMLAGGDLVLLLAFLVIFGLYYIPRKQRREGRRLLKRFGMDYAQYVVSVNSLVPRLKPYEGANAVRFSFQQVIRNNEHQTALSLLIAVAVLVLKYFWSHPWITLPPSILRYL